MARAPAQSASLSPPQAQSQSASLWQHAWRRLRRNKLAVVGASAIILLAVLAIGADVIAPYHYTTPNFGRNFEFPNREFLLGTDHLGRDVLSRIIYGARVSMTVGVVAECIVLAIGVPLGALAGFYGGRLDMILMRFVHVMYAFPNLLFCLLILLLFGSCLRQLLCDLARIV